MEAVPLYAGMVELVDINDLKSFDRKVVRVQVSLPVLFFFVKRRHIDEMYDWNLQD